VRFASSIKRTPRDFHDRDDAAEPPGKTLARSLATRGLASMCESTRAETLGRSTRMIGWVKSNGVMPKNRQTVRTGKAGSETRTIMGRSETVNRVRR
jgi:hypothetical protein